jgi:hypothetical protein
MKNNNNNLTSVSVVKRNRHDDGAKISMMANDIAVTRVTSEKLKMYQDEHDDMLYHTIISLMDAPNHGANDTFEVDGKLYNFTSSGYEAVLKKFDTIRHKLEEAQAASEKLPGMEEAYTKLISEVLGINTEDVANMDKADDDMKEKYNYIVIETDKECDANTAEDIHKALSSANTKVFDVEINNNGLTTNLIGVLTTSHNKALKIVLDYLGDGMPSSFKEFHESGMVSELGYSKKWSVGDISITSNEGVISRLTNVILIDKDCELPKSSASEPDKLNEKHCCNCDNCCDKGNKEVCQGCFDCEENAQPLELSNNCDGGKTEPDSDVSLKDTTTPPQTVKQVSIPVGYPEVTVPTMKSIDVPDIEALDVNTGDIGLSVTAGDMTDISGNITFNVSGDIIIDSFNGGRNNTNRK